VSERPSGAELYLPRAPIAVSYMQLEADLINSILHTFTVSSQYGQLSPAARFAAPLFSSRRVLDEGSALLVGTAQSRRIAPPLLTISDSIRLLTADFAKAMAVLERPSDAEPDHLLPLAKNIVLVYDLGVVSHNQTEGDIDHWHLDAEFHP
jgi:hypothetical protein